MGIRVATEADLREMKRWLKEEEDATGEGFHRNWDVIESCHRRGMLEVLRVDGAAVAFLCDAHKGPDIIEVHPNHRRRGYARALMEKAIQNARARGNSVIEIECAPPESATVWERLGFTIRCGVRRNGNGIPGYMLLPRRIQLPDGPNVTVSVSFYPEARGDTSVAPFWTFRGNGVRDDEGAILLPERLIFFDAETQDLGGCHVRIEVDGMHPVITRLNSAGASQLGVEQGDDGVYFLERLVI